MPTRSPIARSSAGVRRECRPRPPQTWSPTRGRPPRGALHFAAPCLMEHFVTPFALLRQQVTNPGFPHVDLAAHRTMAPREAFGLPFTACATHRTYVP